MRNKKPVVLISCASKKMEAVAPAKDLYISESFKKARACAEVIGSEWFVLSAKHGLLPPNELTAPYDMTLNTMSLTERRAWAERVIAKLGPHLIQNKKVIILAGEAYRRDLEAMLRGRGCEVIAPLEGLPIGKQLQLLDRVSANKSRFSQHERFLASLCRLEQLPNQMIPFKDLTAKDMPSQGLYIFYDSLEKQRFQFGEHPRIVRIGTHAVSQGSRSSLWQRLRSHRGADDGGGSHRSSVFRLHVGNALLFSKDVEHPTWGLGATASEEVRLNERWLELEVSEYISNLYVTFLGIYDEANADSDRSYIEKNIIALLTYKGRLDVQTSGWLGNFSKHDHIRKSGLWNVNYVGDYYDPAFLEIFDKLVDSFSKGKRMEKSIAPPHWRLSMKSSNPEQPSLF